MSDLMLDVDQADEEIKPIEHIIDCSVPVFCPDGWQVLPDSEQLPNRTKGIIQWDRTKSSLYLSKKQEKGSIDGHDLRNELDTLNQQTYTAHLLDYLIKPENQHLIPNEWKGKAVFFWGTIYNDGDDSLCVRCLCLSGVGWSWGYRWLDADWNSRNPVLLLASAQN